MAEPGSLLAPEWYADGVGEPATSHEAALASLPWPVAKLAGTVPFVRGLALALLGHGRRLAVIKGAPGSSSALVASALFRRSRGVIVLEFIQRPESRSKLRGWLREQVRRAFEAPSIRTAMAVGHTLTAKECLDYASLYGTSVERFALVRWPLCRTGTATPAQIARGRRRVFSSGRAGSDWETLFAAAEGADWELTAVCSELDRARVERLSGGRAKVHCELDRGAHDEILRASDVYVMAMTERGVSAGHVRLMAAVEAGVPVVASRIEALADYVVPGETAVLVEPGVAVELRRAIEALLADAEERERMRNAALARAQGWTAEHYFERMRSLMLEDITT